MLREISCESILSVCCGNGWPDDGKAFPSLDDDAASCTLLEQIRSSIRDLKPIDDGRGKIVA